MLSNELSQANKLEKKQTIGPFSISCLHYDKMYTTACNKEISEWADAEIRGFLELLFGQNGWESFKNA